MRLPSLELDQVKMSIGVHEAHRCGKRSPKAKNIKDIKENEAKRG